MIFLLWTALAFGGSACDKITLSDIAAVPEPAIIVLGERRGAHPDVGRAARVLTRLLKKTEQPVTLAADIVHHNYQNHLDRYASGKINRDELEANLEWSKNSGTQFAPYGRIFRLSEKGLRLQAVGSDLVGPPDDLQVPVPGVYPTLVSSVIPDGEMEFGLDNRIAQTMAYWDYQVAMRALNDWNGQGYLVILTERARTEGGGGVPWQLTHASDHAVYAFLLAWAEAYCGEGDDVWAANPILTTLGLTR